MSTRLPEAACLPPAESSVQFVGRYEDAQQPEQEKAMRPSISLTLEPGLKQGVPWGRDLYTFVTSAAGHMMRTLQKPRKSRPSKRRVNHRRFLHNMIQRKFADIEAANHRLASALYFKQEEQVVSSGTSERSVGRSPADPDKPDVHTDEGGLSKVQSDVSAASHGTEMCERKQPESGHLWKRHPKSQSNAFTAGKNNQGKGPRRQKKGTGFQKVCEFTEGLDYFHREELFHPEYYESENLLKPTSSPSEDTQAALSDSGFIQTEDISPSFSPDLSPLSLDSCDFSIQMFTDVSTCPQAQRSHGDMEESPWTDVMDLFGVGGKDSLDVEAYFESICARQDDAGAEGGVDDDQSGAFTERICSNVADVERGEYRYEYGYSCHGDQGMIVNHFQSDQRNSQAAETQFNDLTASNGADAVQNQLHAPISCSYQLQNLQEERNNLNLMLFEGVAQSFSAPLHNPEFCHIPTPPHNDDWLFNDILNDRRSQTC